MQNPDPGNSHDLSLPDWGPYSKRFFGVSHIPDDSGDRFDFAVAPGLHERCIFPPDVLRPCGYLPWDVTSDLEHYSIRQQLEWKDRLYCDISYHKVTDRIRLVKSRLVNNTESTAEFNLHFLSQYVTEPAGRLSTDAQEYFRCEMESETGLEYDFMFPGEFRCPGSTTGSAYRIKSGVPFSFAASGKKECFYLLRARGDGKVTVDCCGRKTTLELTRDWQFFELEKSFFATGRTTFVSDGDFECDGLFSSEKSQVTVYGNPVDNRAEIDFEAADTLIWHYPGSSRYYGLRLDRNYNFYRNYDVGDYNASLLYKAYVNHGFLRDLGETSSGDRIIDCVLQPLAVEAGKFLDVCCAAGTAETFDELKSELEKTVFEVPSGISYLKTANHPWNFSVSRLKAVILSNIVYPTRMADKFVRHHTPGRKWNCLYTWDSGFIGLGLMECDEKRAVENLNAYLASMDDPDHAFVHHGSPVPVQIYLYFELLNRFGSIRTAKEFYPRVKRFYDYLAGHDPRSLTTRYSRDPMVCTWDYFYNSGGWDDYPAQHARPVEKKPDEEIIPVVGTAHIIRCAAMLKMAAELLGFDSRCYEHDIEVFSNSLNQNAWDEDAGYYSYTKYDRDGNFTGIFRHSSGANYNMGLDGAMPLVAGCAPEKRAERLWSHLTTPGECWCNAGLSAVDQSAPYYRTDGYWNGTVWLPYCYFFWKAALDAGKADFAWQLASTCLDEYEHDTRASYACYEHFSAENRRASGWHHFSALSSPAVSFAAAYGEPGTVTNGFDVLRTYTHCDGKSLEAGLRFSGKKAGSVTVIAVLDLSSCTATFNGREIPVFRRLKNVYEFSVPRGTDGVLKVVPA